MRMGGGSSTPKMYACPDPKPTVIDGMERKSIVIDGKKHAEGILLSTKQKVLSCPITPNLIVVLVGNNQASASYVKMKEKAAAKCGISSRVVQLVETISQEQLLSEIAALNRDITVHGILVQLPLPEHLHVSAVLSSISHLKDVRVLLGLACARALLIYFPLQFDSL
jgi:methylenetetrahydrofolate dehydrogenase (NADP+)/methenyltetrahydrofolate cyclohydrolase